MQIGEFIRLKRKEKKLTLKQLAKDIGLSYTYLSQIELGDRNASPEILEKLSNHLNVSYSDLMEKAGYMGERSILIKALETQGKLIEDIREIKNQIMNTEKVFPIYDTDIFDTKNKKTDLMKKFVDVMEGMLKELSEQIENYSNPNNDKEEIESTLKSLLDDVRGHAIMREAFFTSINAVEVSSLMDNNEQKEIIDFIDEYLAQENDLYFSDFEEYSQQKGFDLYKTLDREQMEKVFKFLLQRKKLEMKRSELKNYDVIKNQSEKSAKDATISPKVSKEPRLDLDHLLNSNENIFYKGKKLEIANKEQVLKMLDVLFPDAKSN